MAGENDSIACTVDGRHVVVVGGLIRNFGDERNGGGIGEIRDLVQLPITDARVIVLKPRRTDRHAEDSLRPAPMNARPPHRDAVRGLRAPTTVGRSARQILHCAGISILQPGNSDASAALTSRRNSSDVNGL